MPAGDPEDIWVDEDAGPVVRPFAVARGRTRQRGGELDLITVVVTAEVPVTAAVLLGPEDELILQSCLNPRSVADLVADLALPVGVVRVLLGDLLERGLVEVLTPAARSGRPDASILREVINGLRAL
ncbi:DUF742 domain-containing protein [Actinomadura sp. 7K507]|uniref:DUF742 domain-containing protein n=1 Tax=Actinomadura sp. 7K507 TaxID=2530365 RepID=UPI0010500F75|nr:DUF742 domain-containing protein [Actinomadura sp. 7K507]TDC80242.1 DUF742 domain-containing protein [Actinomadura sp. 7K507]